MWSVTCQLVTAALLNSALSSRDLEICHGGIYTTGSDRCCEAGLLHTTYLDVPLIRQDVMMSEEKIQEFLLKIGL